MACSTVRRRKWLRLRLKISATCIIKRRINFIRLFYCVYNFQKTSRIKTFFRIFNIIQTATLKRDCADLYLKKVLSPLVLSLSKYSSGKIDKSEKVYMENYLLTARRNPSLDSHFMLTRDDRVRGSARAEFGLLKAYIKTFL